MLKSSLIAREEIDAFMGIALEVADRVLGILYIDFRSPHKFKDEEKDIIRLFARQIAIAVYNARLFEQATSRLEQRKVLQEIARDITSVLEADTLLDKILEHSLELLRCPVGSIALQNKATGELIYRYAKGKRVGSSLSVDKGLMTMAAKEQRPVRVGDVTKEPWPSRYVRHVPETRPTGCATVGRG